jgi:hypothetical protein
MPLPVPVANFSVLFARFLGFILSFSFSPPYFVEEICDSENFVFWGFFRATVKFGILSEKREGKRKNRAK